MRQFLTTEKRWLLSWVDDYLNGEKKEEALEVKKKKDEIDCAELH